MDNKTIEELTYIEIEEMIKDRFLTRLSSILFSITTLFLMFMKILSKQFNTFDLTIVTMIFFSFIFPILMNERTKEQIIKEKKRIMSKT